MGGWLTFASRLLGRPKQFMNDSPHCQADSLFAWGLGRKEADGPLCTSHTCAHTRIDEWAGLQRVHLSVEVRTG